MEDLAEGSPQPCQPQFRSDRIRLCRSLGIQLAGPASYFGKRLEKPYIGDAVREIEPEDILRTNRIMMAASVVAVILGLFISYQHCVSPCSGFTGFYKQQIRMLLIPFYGGDIHELKTINPWYTAGIGLAIRRNTAHSLWIFPPMSARWGYLRA